MKSKNDIRVKLTVDLTDKQRKSFEEMIKDIGRESLERIDKAIDYIDNEKQKQGLSMTVELGTHFNNIKSILKGEEEKLNKED